MKKLKVGIVSILMGMLIISGCGNTKGSTNASSSQSSSQQESSEKASKESSSSLTIESTEETEEAKSGNSSQFSLMIEAAQSQVPNLKKQYEGMYSDITISEGEDSTIVYTYTFAQEAPMDVDAEALKPTLVKALKPVIDGAKVMVPDVKIQVIFLNPDNSEVINFVITQEDTDSVDAES
ncbi:hypothetical protein [Enterococcus termitis]|jgi:hypothetical protein|uniref:Uncharacterized protein n=1 Tax=Enterococcus termitis TaxID=332950 RepID=A0A1E5GJR6_9ENTE|nr:hypothetical protein [Enterococcus termitis]OEG12966.1 hypothetical protein BCR25_05615 [Enterococcus termitis]OJG99189.1 hypothetical protein RV18_GL002343 [Enterococcus termitis]